MTAPTAPLTVITEPGVLARFMAKVDTSSDCHIWTGSKTPGGYGQFRVGDKSVYAHRWILGHQRGVPLGADEFALHHCDNPSCVNPAHLYVGSQAQNSQDCVRRGRLRNPRADANRAKTHCIHGHEFTAENTYLTTDGRRQCNQCRRASWTRDNARRKALRKASRS